MIAVKPIGLHFSCTLPSWLPSWAGARKLSHFFRAGFLTVCSFVMLLTLPEMGLTFPSHLRVRLFDAHRPLACVYVKSPFVVPELGRSFARGVYAFTATTHGVVLSSESDPHLHLNAPRYTLTNEDRGLTIGYEKGQGRSYRGSLRISLAEARPSSAGGSGPVSLYLWLTKSMPVIMCKVWSAVRHNRRSRRRC